MRHASKRLLILRRLWCTARTVAPTTPTVGPATTTMSRKAWLYASLFDAQSDEQDRGTHRRGKRP